MLNNFIFGLNNVLPIFIVLTFGYLLRKRKYLTKDTIKNLNILCYKFFIPILLFRDVSSSNLTNSFNLNFLIFCFITNIIIFFALWLISSFFIKNKKTLASFVQGSFRSNYAIIGLPLIQSILGVLPIEAIIVTTFILPIYNIFSIIVLNSANEDIENKNILNIIITIFKNPLILGILMGIPFSLLNINFPIFLETSIKYLSNISSPLAILIVGASLNFSKIKRNLKLSLTACFIKLIAIPLIFLPIGYFIGFSSPNELIVLYVMYGTPTAVNSYIMANRMGADTDLASNIVILSIVLSIITFTVALYTFYSLGII